MKETKKNSFYLIDGYALLYRSHFALIRNPLINSKGQHTSAVYGFTNTLLKLIKEESPDYIVAVFDGKEKLSDMKCILNIKLLVKKCLMN